MSNESLQQGDSPKGEGLKLKKPDRSKIWGNLLALLFGIFISLVLAEIILRIFHPIPFRVKHGKIVLPANQKIVHKNPASKKLEHTIIYSRNSLGMRGEEMPKDPKNWIKIITIGGSTTECSYNSDSMTWPEVLKRELRRKMGPNVWVNNAGLDGTSTFGHIMLLKEHIISLHPDYVIFLTGVNDVENDVKDNFDLYHSDEMNKSSVKEYLRSLMKKTEIGGLVENFYRYRMAYNKGLVHREVDYAKEKRITIDSANITLQLAKQKRYLEAYHERIMVLDAICRANHIHAIFLTQPSLYASFTDPETKLDFSDIKTSDGRNASLEGQILEQYNNVLRNSGHCSMIDVIDLERAMPLNSKFYYDYTHFTIKGTDTLGRMLSDSMKRFWPISSGVPTLHAFK